jgi:hypothetical protein
LHRKAGPAQPPSKSMIEKKKQRQDPAGEATLNSEWGGSRSRIRPIRARLNKPCGNPRRHVDATDRTRPGDDAPSRECPLRCRATSGIVVQSDRPSAFDGSGLGIHHDVVVLHSPPSLHSSPDPAHLDLGNSLRRPNPTPRVRRAPSSVEVPPSALLTRYLVIRVADAIMPCEGIAPAKCLLLGAEVAVHLPLLGIVNCRLVSRKVVRAREVFVAGVAGAWVDAFASVGASLAVHQSRRAWCEALCPSSATPVAVLLVLLK